ncbi:MAG: helix-turn-helix transcriptional regulator, partial [Actinomycetota bacterium]|nr:helix-turn-helix transcriptional regulator [Actinomycetota bacterium]
MAGSSAPLRRLGAELRRLRVAAGRTQTEVGTAIGRTHATMVNWELGKTKISKPDLVSLLAELRAPLDVRKELEQLREEAGQGAGQWAVYGLPDRFRPFVSFEEDAVAEASFQPVIVPGLLQTEEYARATYLAARYLVAPRA